MQIFAWPHSRNRPPAVPKARDVRGVDIRKRLRPSAPSPVKPPATPASPHPHGQQQQHYQEFYERVNSGHLGGPAAAKPRQPLFSRKPNTAAETTSRSTTTSSSSTPALRAKLGAAFRTTQQWTRVQRKLLPKFLFVLDAVTATQLLQCLARLQPLAVTAVTVATQQQGAPVAVAEPGLLRPQPQPQCPQPQLQQQQQQGLPGLEQLSQLPTSILAALSGPQPGTWPSPPPTQPQLAAAHDTAVAQGFPDAAAARAEFESMLSAVYAVLAHKLQQWPFSVLVQVVCCAGQMALLHQGFIQAWLEASAAGLTPQQPAAALFSCMEALSRLQAQPPLPWWQAWQAASQAQLAQLPLKQLAALQLHLLHLQLQPTDSWWAAFQAAVLQQALEAGGSSRNGGSSDHAAAGGSNSAGRRSSSSDNRTRSRSRAEQQEPQVTADTPQQAPAQSTQNTAGTGTTTSTAAAAAAVAGRSLNMGEADALCTLLCTCHLLPHPPPDKWLQALLQLCTAAGLQGRASTGGALQLLFACCCGACRGGPGAAAAAAAAQEAALALLQRRLRRLHGTAAVAVLFACLRNEAKHAQLPEGFAAGLAVRLAELVPAGWPVHLLLQVPSVMAAMTPQQQQQQQPERLVAAFALATQARLGGMQQGELQVLLSGCDAAGWKMPRVWGSAVAQRAAELPC